MGYRGPALFILLAIIAIVIISMRIGDVLYALVIRIRNRRAPVIRVDAEVTRKRSAHEGQSIVGGYSGDNVCLVTFLFNGQEVEFSVPQSIYCAVDDGNQGLLVYQGSEVVHFIPSVK